MYSDENNIKKKKKVVLKSETPTQIESAPTSDQIENKHYIKELDRLIEGDKKDAVLINRVLRWFLSGPLNKLDTFGS